MDITDEQVHELCSILGLDPAANQGLIYAALRANDGDFNKVVSEYFDDVDKFRAKHSWDENAFGADRAGDTNTTIPSFTIHSPPDDGQNVIDGIDPGNGYWPTPGAPSRPPSRANNRSPISKVADWAVESFAGGAPNSKDQEEADLQRALAESMRTSPIPNLPEPQESGLVESTVENSNNPYFRRATKDTYDQNEWAMIRLKQDNPDPPPSGRKRLPGAPAFLRCRKLNESEKHRVGSIVTILHAIPAARNALLSSETETASFGQEFDWWKGKAILAPNFYVDDGQPATAQWSEELQRLLAFLDATDRSYGTADVLADIEIPALWSADRERLFFDALYTINTDDEGSLKPQIHPLMSQAEVVPILSSEDGITNFFTLLDLSRPYVAVGSVDSLYQWIDGTFFMVMESLGSSRKDLVDSQMAMYRAAPEVLVIRITDEFPNMPDVPETLYLDRYMAEHRAEMIEIQTDLHAVFRALEKAFDHEAKVVHWSDPDKPENFKPQADLIEQLTAKRRQDIAQLKADKLWETYQTKHEAGDDADYLPDHDLDEVELSGLEADIEGILDDNVEEMQQLLVEIDDHLKHLQIEKQACAQAMQVLNSLLTGPSEDPRWNATHKYTLRGVVNTPDMTYICRRAEADLMDMEGAPPPADQWWKLGYAADDDEPVKADMVNVETVLRETCGAGSRPILIYSTEKALEEPLAPLSEALKTFVKFDNRLFKQDIIQDSPRDKKRSVAGPSSPSKRLNRTNSLDSIATDRASIGDFDERNPYDVDPFGEPEGPTVEMHELVDFSEPAAAGPSSGSGSLPTPPYEHERVESPTLGHFANVSLEEVAAAAETQGKAPEMQEREGQRPLLTLANGKARAATASSSSNSMDIDMDTPVEQDLVQL